MQFLNLALSFKWRDVCLHYFSKFVKNICVSVQEISRRVFFYMKAYQSAKITPVSLHPFKISNFDFETLEIMKRTPKRYQVHKFFRLYNVKGTGRALLCEAQILIFSENYSMTVTSVTFIVEVPC